MNKCADCIKKYSDKWGVPLLSGTKRSRDEKCARTCEREGTTPEQVKTESRGLPILLFFILIVLAVACITTYFAGIQLQQEKMKKMRYSSDQPVTVPGDLR